MSEQTHQRRLKRFTAWTIGIAALGASAFAACADDPDQAQSPLAVEQQAQAEMQLEQAAVEQAQAAWQQDAVAQSDQVQAQLEHDQAQEQAEYVESERAADQQEARESASTSQPQSSPRNEHERRVIQPGQPADTAFRDYPTTGWRKTENDHTSTFSLDVDRTSYFLALNWVEAGFQIEPASVRAEEWINAFNYHYELPVANDSFAVTTDIVQHAIHPDLHLVRVAAQAPEFVDETPLNVTLVLDASGSMREGNRVEIARAAADTIRSGLRDQDRLAIVQFSTDVVDVVDHRSADATVLVNSIDRLEPLASTNVQAGLNQAVILADEIRRERPDAYNYIILMSDGVANVDATDPFQILATAEDRDASNPLRLITIGVGIHNYNDVLLEQLAQYGNGWYRYLSDVPQARATFSRDNWLALSIPFADQARAQIRWDQRTVAHWRLIGYENRITSDASFEQDRKEFAEIPMGAATTAFFEVELTDRARNDRIVDLGEIELRWLTPMSDETNRQQVQVVSDISGFGDDPLLDLGSIVALAADRYSWFGQPDLDDDVMISAEHALGELLHWFWSLPSEILDTRAGQDFGALISSMADAMVAEPESENPSYSR